jgi:hypothetical protein
MRYDRARKNVDRHPNYISVPTRLECRAASECTRTGGLAEDLNARFRR